MLIRAYVSLVLVLLLTACTTPVESITVGKDKQFTFLTENQCSVSDVPLSANQSYWLSFEYADVKDWNIQSSSPPMVLGEACDDEQRDDFNAEQTFSELGFCSNASVMTSTEWLRRESDAHWFEIILSINKCSKKTRVKLQDVETRVNNGVKQYRYTPDQNGELSIFVNDLWLMYFNNKGQITVTVSE